MDINETTVQDILKIAKGVKFGELVIKIQDSNIVHIEKIEKFRLSKYADPKKEGGSLNNHIQTD